jgi:tellurite resistance protein TehA-like permease
VAIQVRDIQVSPDVFSVVMATGTLSVAARNHHYTWISETLSGLALLGLAILIFVVLMLSVAKRPLVSWTSTDPDVPLKLFTFVAACCVLASRLSAIVVVLTTLATMAGMAWLALAVLSLRTLSAHPLVSLRDQADGDWLLASVGTTGLAIVTAQLAGHTGHRQWLIASVSLSVVAIGIYIAMAWLMVWRAVLERLDQDGFEPDTWILMGSLAIVVVAGHYIHRQVAGWLAAGMLAVSVVSWVLATLWIPVLVYFSLHRVEQRPRLLRFTGAWWTLAFPLGMYSAATYAMAADIHLRSLQTVALVFFWIALAVWLIVAVAGLLRIPTALGALSWQPAGHSPTAATQAPSSAAHDGLADIRGLTRVHRSR